MKKNLLAVAAIALLVAGCAKGTIETPRDEYATVRFNAGSQTILDTRAGGQAYTGVIGVNPEGTPATWEIAPTDIAFAGDLSSTSSALTVSGAAVSEGAVQVKSTGAQTAKFVAFGVAAGTVSGNNAVYTLAANGEGTGLENDYIYATTSSVVNGNATVSFAFNHVMAKLRIELYEQVIDAANKVDATSATISGFNTLSVARNGSIDITTGTVTPSNTYLPTAIALNTEYFVIPVTDMNSSAATFTLNYKSKDYTITVPAGVSLVANKCRVIRLTLKGSGVTFDATLEDWADENTDIDLQ